LKNEFSGEILMSQSLFSAMRDFNNATKIHKNDSLQALQLMQSSLDRMIAPLWVWQPKIAAINILAVKEFFNNDIDNPETIIRHGTRGFSARNEQLSALMLKDLNHIRDSYLAAYTSDMKDVLYIGSTLDIEKVNHCMDRFNQGARGQNDRHIDAKNMSSALFEMAQEAEKLVPSDPAYAVEFAKAALKALDRDTVSASELIDKRFGGLLSAGKRRDLKIDLIQTKAMLRMVKQNQYNIG
jgi:hypothetical protein